MKSSAKIAVVGPLFPYRGGISVHTSNLLTALKQSLDKDVLGYSFSRQFPKHFYPFATDKDLDYAPDYRHEDANYCIDSVNPLTWL
ncbi:MAG: hypothetical protein AAGA45_08205, partial [Verrucomicrobiota bacterium]